MTPVHKAMHPGHFTYIKPRNSPHKVAAQIATNSDFYYPRKAIHVRYSPKLAN
jgi:hypothetical protein